MSIKNHRGLIDTFSDPPVIYFCGPGGYKLTESPGTRKVPLATAPSGHLLMPMSDFLKITKTEGQQLIGNSQTQMHLPTSSGHSGAASSSQPPPVDNAIVMQESIQE